MPDEIKDLLGRAAARSGQSMQGYLLGVLEREAKFARNAELAEMEPVDGGPLSMDEIVDAVRAARGDAEPRGGAGAA